MPEGAARLIGLVLAAVLALATPARAESGFSGEGLAFQLVAYPGDVTTALFLADLETNAPVEGASIEADDGVWQGVARPTASPGIYELPWKPPPRGADLVVTIGAQGRDDLILLRDVEAGSEGEGVASWVLILGGGLLLLAGFAIRRRKPITAMLVLALLGAPAGTFAHGDDSHGQQAQAGEPLTLDKPTQFQLEIRTRKPAQSLSAEGKTLAVIPAQAVMDLSGQPVVFVRLGPETFEARRVTVAGTQNGLVLLSDGIVASDLVVVQGAEHFQPVEAVSPRSAVSDSAWYGGQSSPLPGGGRVEMAVGEGVIWVWLRDATDRPLLADGVALVRRNGRTIAVPVKDGVALASVNPSERLAVVVRLKQARKLLTARFAQAELMTPVLSPDAAAGKLAFDGICARCHGQALRGTEKAPPLLHALYAPGSGHGDSLILAAMAHGAIGHMWKFGDMPKPEGLAPGQDRQILTYIRAMQVANGLGDGSSLGSDVCVINP
jgi:mono/diheme cytochrome c family protein